MPRSARSLRAGSDGEFSRPGRLVLVVGADPAGLAVLLDATRRRFLCDSGISFPVVATTRRGLYSGSELVLNRREFNAVAATGGFFATWAVGDAMAALPVSTRDMLECGGAVVVGVPHDRINDGSGREQQPWPDMRIVRVSAHTELARVSLSPRACLSRMLGPRDPGFARAHRAPERVDARVYLGDTMGTAVSRIGDAIAGVARPSPSSHQIEGARRTA